MTVAAACAAALSTPRSAPRHRILLAHICWPHLPSRKHRMRGDITACAAAPRDRGFTINIALRALRRLRLWRSAYGVPLQQTRCSLLPYDNGCVAPWRAVTRCA
jgi:hypothetical protein